MADVSVRDTVVNAIAAQAATILKANGYSEDCGRHVYDHPVPIEVADVPCVIIVEDPEDIPTEKQTTERTTRALGLIVVAVCSYAGQDRGQKARQLIAHIQDAIDVTFTVTVPLRSGGTGPHVVNLWEEMNTPRVFPGSQKIAAEVRFRVEYKTSRYDATKH